MRILFVTPVIPTQTDGRRPYNFIKYLATRHSVHVIALRLPVQKEEDLRRLRALGATVESFRIGGLGSLARCAIGLLRGEPLRVAWCRRGEARKAMLRMLAAESIDIVHFDRMRMGQYALGVPDVPKLIDFTDALTLYLERSAPLRHKISERLIDRYEARTIPSFESRILDHVDVVLFCSERDAEHFRRHHPSASVEVVENSVDTEEFKPRSRGRDSVARCIMTGNLFYFPNVDGALYFQQSIWRKVRDSLGNMEVQIIGSRPEPEILALSGRDGMRVIADVERMWEYLYSDDIYVCPLRVGAGIRNKLLEAMAAGMAIVTTSLGCEGLRVTPDREVVIADKPDEFADAIIHLANHSEVRRQLGERARQYVLAHHRSEVIGQKIERVYYSLIAQQRKLNLPFVPRRTQS